VAADEPVPKREVEMNNVYGQREQDRKVRREIANSNERRRMQSINAGFKSLKTILPHADGDKLSKVRPTIAKYLSLVMGQPVLDVHSTIRTLVVE